MLFESFQAGLLQNVEYQDLIRLQIPDLHHHLLVSSHSTSLQRSQSPATSSSPGVTSLRVQPRSTRTATMGLFSKPAFLKSPSVPTAPKGSSTIQRVESMPVKHPSSKSKAADKPKSLMCLWEVELKRGRRPGWEQPPAVEGEEPEPCPG